MIGLDFTKNLQSTAEFPRSTPPLASRQDRTRKTGIFRRKRSKRDWPPGHVLRHPQYGEHQRRREDDVRGHRPRRPPADLRGVQLKDSFCTGGQYRASIAEIASVTKPHRTSGDLPHRASYATTRQPSRGGRVGCVGNVESRHQHGTLRYRDFRCCSPRIMTEGLDTQARMNDGCWSTNFSVCATADGDG